MISTFVILATIMFISMMSPGPDMMLIVKYSGAKTRWPAVSCIAGVCSGVLVHITLSILGIAAIIAASATIYTALKLLGAAYLIYIGVQSLRSGGKFSFGEIASVSANSNATPFRDGLLCNVLNPKVTLFILAVFTQVIEPSTPFIEKVAYGLFIAVEAFVVWNLFVSVIRTKLVLGLIQRFQVIIDRVVGVVLICFGGSLIFEKSR